MLTKPILVIFVLKKYYGHAYLDAGDDYFDHTTIVDKQEVPNESFIVQINVHRIQYRFSEAAADNHRLGESSLVDRGANGGLAGEDICVIEHTLRKADISGINNHTVVGLPIVTAAGVVQTLAGPVSLILHQYALIGKGKSIHSRCKWNVMTSW